ncbi:MAG: DUF1080 domain-containing protein [Candidatus Sumerlaeota bacterium]|nr:DUF1080 domain-containing protein [Candidatus Sumerlaeota bacterium]
MRVRPLFAMALSLAACASHAAETRVSLAVDPANVVGRIDEKIYGHFLEHIYHSVNGGLWGEMVWQRSFEEGAGGNWSLQGDTVAQKSLADNVRLMFGDPSWKDYEFTLEARKTGGAEGFLILFRATSRDDFYWYNFGGWGNKKHALERGAKGDGRWRPIEPGRPGAIETDRWYRIRVRCEGPRLQVFLDDEQLLDFTDTKTPHLAGRVGIGAWRTAAQFRNLKVTSLDGKTLFDGLPPDLSSEGVAKGWTPYGEGRFEWPNENPLNGECCQAISPAADQEAGIAQTPFCIEKGETYRGSVWARGEAAEGLVVRLRDGDKSLAEASLGKPDTEWKEFAFGLKPADAAPNATLEIGANGAGKVWIDQASLMSDAALATGGYRPDLLRAVADLRPPIIRWPGGSFAKWYLWKDGIGPQSKRVKYPRVIWDDQDCNSYGTDEFIAMCRRIHSEPLLVINIGSNQPPEKRPEMIRYAQEWAEYCNGPATSTWGRARAANGHSEPYHVKYWEIDNETWGMKAEPYAQAVREFVPALKEIDPSIRIAACGSGGFNLEWNRVLIERCADLVDYLSIHYYEKPDNFADGPRKYEEFFRQTGQLIAASANPKMKLFVSEWNAQCTNWRTGLYAAGLLNAFERSDAVEIASPALFLRHVSAAKWDNAFINFDHRTWFPAPNYVAMKLWRDHYAPRRLGIEGDCGPLNAAASVSEDGKTVYFKTVNPQAEAVEVELTIAAGFEADKAEFQLVNPGDLAARNTLDEPHKIQPKPAAAKIEGHRVRFSMPPLSAGVVTISGQ